MIGSDRAQHLFPFSIQLNHELEICGLGRSLAKRIPEARGQRFNDVFGLLRWNDGFGAEALQKRIGRTCLISHESLKLTLRGEFVSLEPNGGWLFIGVPRIVTIADLSETGLSIGDFAAHDPIIDYLFLLQRNQTNLDEALRSAQALSKSQGRYRLLVEQSHDLICSVDEQGSVVFANRAWTYCLGDNSVNCGIASLLSPSSHGTWAECVDALRQNAKPQKVSLEFQAESGVRILADGILKKTVLEDEGVRIVGFLRDVTQQEEVRTALQKSQDQFRQAQKMEAIGRLAGGIAHDFNNLLGVVLGAAGMLREELAESDPRRADVDVILSTAEKGAALTRQLLVFSRKHRTGGQQTELVAQTQEMTRILKRILDRAVVLDVSHPPCQIHVDIDPGQYEQILMNLVINARDAMPEGGNLSITLDVNGQQEARVRVRDTGIGMDKETQEQIFEPFFTTKGQDQGTGLGLAMVYSSAASLGGDVLVDSAPGEGTEITVIFPTAAPRHGRKHTGQVQPQQRARLKDDGSAPTIFLVEDQIELRTLGVRTLANQGYDVREFSGITQAREAFSAAKQPPDLLITDVRLLDGVGTDLAEEMHQRGLVSRVLIVTGYASLGRIESLMMRYGWRLLMKPYSNKQLVSLVYELLSSGPD